MQYLVMENRILNLEHRDFDINKPMPRSTDKRFRVTASDPELKITHPLFLSESLEECQQFVAALGRMLNATEQRAVPIEDVLQAMSPSAVEDDKS